jgi:hypothetical protein
MTYDLVGYRRAAPMSEVTTAILDELGHELDRRPLAPPASYTRWTRWPSGIPGYG